MAPQHWDYQQPDKWAEQFKTGPNQSPINILVSEPTCCAPEGPAPRPRAGSAGSASPVSSDESQVSQASQESRRRHQHQAEPGQRTRLCLSNKKIFLGYPRYLHTMELANTGHGWQVSLPRELASHTLVSGPPLAEREYRLAQLHCHWGRDCEHGSEHQVNGRSFAAELHFVHWNCTHFESIEEAAKHKHGLAVLAVFVQLGAHNRHLEKICAGLGQVQRPGQRCSLGARLDLKKLFPANRWHYASYEGSLTTPPLSEVVDWLVFLEPIQASEAQIESFRQLGCGHRAEREREADKAARLDRNCRPVQPLNGRLVSIWSHH